MSFKTEYQYNEDNFVQDNGMKEITVTITLGEYRNLLQELARAELYVERLQNEKNELEEKLEVAQNAMTMAIKMPERLRAIINTLASLFDDEKETEEADEE